MNNIFNKFLSFFNTNNKEIKIDYEKRYFDEYLNLLNFFFNNYSKDTISSTTLTNELFVIFCRSLKDFPTKEEMENKNGSPLWRRKVYQLIDQYFVKTNKIEKLSKRMYKLR